MKQFTCKHCVHAGNPHSFGDSDVVECRCAPVTVSGFPIVSTTSWCTPGKNDTVKQEPAQTDELVDEGEPSEHPQDRPEDFITQRNEDGSIITLHIPTVIMGSYQKLKTLELEVEMLKRKS